MARHELQFTKGSIAALPCPEKGKQATWYDTKSRGLCVMVSYSGKKSFDVLRKFKGKPERILLGRFPDTTVAMARRRAGELNAQFDAGINPNDAVRRERNELTLDELQARYMAIQARPRNHRPEKQEYHYRLYLAHWGKRRLSEITKMDVQVLHGQIAEARQALGQRRPDSPAGPLQPGHRLGPVQRPESDTGHTQVQDPFAGPVLAP